MKTSHRQHKQRGVRAKDRPSTSRSQTTRSFHHLGPAEPHSFNRLPPEVRSMIWHIAAAEAVTRLVRVKWLNRRHPFPVMHLDAGPVPSLLHVKESRTEMQLVYRKVRDHHRSDSGDLRAAYQRKPKIVGRYTYVDFTRDIFYYDPKCYKDLSVFRSWARNLELGKAIITDNLTHHIEHIRHAAIPLQAYTSMNADPISPDVEPVIQTCMSHPFLESVSLVFDRSDFFTLRSCGRPGPGPHAYELMDIHLGTDLSGLCGDRRALCCQRNRLFLREAQGFEEIMQLRDVADDQVQQEWKGCKEFLDRFPDWTPPALEVKGLAYSDEPDDKEDIDGRE